jgi:hypothetical protein
MRDKRQSGVAQRATGPFGRGTRDPSSVGGLAEGRGLTKQRDRERERERRHFGYSDVLGIFSSLLGSRRRSYRGSRFLGLSFRALRTSLLHFDAGFNIYRRERVLRDNWALGSSPSPAAQPATSVPDEQIPIAIVGTCCDLGQRLFHQPDQTAAPFQYPRSELIQQAFKSVTPSPAPHRRFAPTATRHHPRTVFRCVARPNFPGNSRLTHLIYVYCSLRHTRALSLSLSLKASSLLL